MGSSARFWEVLRHSPNHNSKTSPRALEQLSKSRNMSLTAKFWKVWSTLQTILKHLSKSPGSPLPSLETSLQQFWKTFPAVLEHLSPKTGRYIMRSGSHQKNGWCVTVAPQVCRTHGIETPEWDKLNIGRPTLSTLTSFLPPWASQVFSFRPILRTDWGRSWSYCNPTLIPPLSAPRLGELALG